MTQRACATCEWAREHTAEPKNLRCCESPQRMTVTPEYWCGRWRLAEHLIRSGAHLTPTEILKHFQKDEQP